MSQSPDRCPFCQSPAALRGAQANEDSMHWWVECTGCGARNGEAHAASTPDQEFAIAAWNTRTQLRTAASEGGEEQYQSGSLEELLSVLRSQGTVSGGRIYFDERKLRPLIAAVSLSRQSESELSETEIVSTTRLTQITNNVLSISPAEALQFLIAHGATIVNLLNRLSLNRDAWERLVEHCMLTETVTPNSYDIDQTIHNLIDWHVCIDAAQSRRTSSYWKAELNEANKEIERLNTHPPEVARDSVTLAEITDAFKIEIARVSTLEFNSNEVSKAFYRNLIKRINPDWDPAISGEAGVGSE